MLVQSVRSWLGDVCERYCRDDVALLLLFLCLLLYSFPFFPFFDFVFHFLEGVVGSVVLS